MRNVYQCFAGKFYLLGASADFADEAAQELANQYEVPEGTIAVIYGCKTPEKITIPSPEK